MKQLGVKVLTKIENLISEIDKPQSSKNTPRPRNNNPNHTISFGDFQEEPKADIYRRLSYSYLNKQEQINKQNKDRAYEDCKDYEQFKVTNKKTMKILSKKQIKPIHERIDEIMQKKDRYVQQLRKFYDEKELETMVPPNVNYDSPNSKKFSHHQLQDYRNEIDFRNKERLRKKHLNELSFVKKHQYTGIPAVNHASRSLSSRRFLQKEYSQNVFKRLNQYAYEKKANKVKMLEQRTEEEGGFHPVIDNNSRQIASRTKDQRSLSNKVLNNSHCKHCDTAKQHEQLKNSVIKPANEIKLIKKDNKEKKGSKDKKASKEKKENKDKSPISTKQNKTTPSKVKNPETSLSKTSNAKTVIESKVSVSKTPIKMNKSGDLSQSQIAKNSKSPLKETTKNTATIKKTIKR